MRFALLIMALIATAILFAESQNYVPDPSWKAPPSAAQARNPLTGVPDALHHGHDLFNTKCAVCHGKEGEGENDAPNLHLAVVQRQSDGTLFWKITEGNPHKGMPAFKEMSDTDRWSLVSYLRMFKTGKKSMSH